MSVMTATRISFAGGCDFAGCTEFAFPLFSQLSRGYERCSLLEVPESLAEWREGHRTARRRAARAFRLGYRFSEIERERFGEDIFQINTSLEERQGRPMSAGYREPVDFSPLPAYPCERHRVRTFGVLSGHRLVAYLWLYRSGELALVSSILGHGAHLADDVMYLLFEGVVTAEAGNGGWFVYNRHDSGTEGLRYFKSKLGFEATEVEWAL